MKYHLENSRVREIIIYYAFYEQHAVILSVFHATVQQLPVADLLAGILKTEWLDVIKL